MAIPLKTLRRLRLLPLMAAAAFLCCRDTAVAQVNTLVVAPTSLTFSGPQGTVFGFQPLAVSATTSAVVVTITPQSTGNWIQSLSSKITATPSAQQVYITVNPGSMAPGQYVGNIQLTGTGITTVNVGVTLNLSANGSAAYTANPSSLSFNATSAGNGTSTSVTVTTTNVNSQTFNLQLSYFNGGGWLATNPTAGVLSAGTPLTFMVTASPGVMPAGVYSGSINLVPAGSTTPILTIPVRFTVAAAQTGPLTSNPTTLTFNFTTASSASQTQNLIISSTSNEVEKVTLSSGNSWLTVGLTPASLGATVSGNVSSNLPVTFVVGAAASGLAASTTGQIQVTSPIGNLTIQVNLNIGSSVTTSLAATPDPINISITGGSTTPGTQLLTVTTSSLTAISFTASVTQPAGQTWLSVLPSDLQAVSINSPVILTVSANAQGLGAGVYNGSQVVLTQPGGASLQVPVSLTVGSAPSISVNPSNLSFPYQSPLAFPPGQIVEITSTGPSVGFGVTAATTDGANWLVVTPPSGVTSATPGAPTPITVQVHPNGLKLGSYTGTITVTSSQASNSPRQVSVNLLVTGQPVLTLDTGAVNFYYQLASSALPMPQEVNLTSSGNPINFTSKIQVVGSGGAFAIVSPAAGATPAALTISLDPAVVANLLQATNPPYQATLELLSNDAGNTAVNIPIYLTIGPNPVLNLSQTNFTFNYQIGKALPVNQVLNLTSSGIPLTYTAAATSNNCGNFLGLASPTGTAPGSIALTVNTGEAAQGTCTGSVTISAQGAANSPVTIPVALNVSASPLLNVSPAAVSLEIESSTNASETIALTSTDPNTAIPFTVTSTTNNGGSWLQAGPVTGSTPQNLTIGLQTSALADGAYFGAVTVTPATLGATPAVIPVGVLVSGSAITPASLGLTFNQAANGPAPASQDIPIGGSVSLTFNATASTLNGGNWLSVSSGSGTIPGDLTVSVNGAALTQGSYSGIITVVTSQSADSTLLIPVTLVIGPAQSISVGSTNVTFTYQAGGAAPAPQTVTVNSAGGSVAFTAVASSPTSGLVTVSPASGTTPGTLSIGLSQTVLAGLAPSSTPYTGTVTVTTPIGGLSINVAVTVQPAAPPAISAITNAASGLAGAISPGEIVSIYGTNIGPATPANLQLTSSGTVAATLANTFVTFNGVLAPLTYVSSGQINAVVPYEVNGNATVSVIASVNGVPSAAVSANVTATVPAIFSENQSGSGQGAILNQDFSVNSASNPAPTGSVVAIFGTGEGVLSPQPATGSVTPSTGTSFPMPVMTPTVTIGGQPAQVYYAGEAPGLVSGVLQVNVKIPANIGSGPQPVVLTIGNVSNAAQSITVSVQ